MKREQTAREQTELLQIRWLHRVPRPQGLMTLGLMTGVEVWIGVRVHRWTWMATF